MRIVGAGFPDAGVGVNGRQRHEVAGRWRASLEWLVGRLAPEFPGVGFGEVRCEPGELTPGIRPRPRGGCRRLVQGDRFVRTRDFYVYCEAAFAIRSPRAPQLVLTRPLNDDLPRYPSPRMTI
jgi:hypothetical protein